MENVKPFKKQAFTSELDIYYKKVALNSIEQAILDEIMKNAQAAAKEIVSHYNIESVFELDSNGKIVLVLDVEQK